MSDTCKWLEYVGAVFLAYISLKLALAFIHFVRVYLFGSYPNFQKFGSWSVVTGATDGIGLAFAQELAKRGQNIVLISRSLEKLEATASSIGSEYNVEVKTIVADFSDLTIYNHIKQELSDLDVGVLVNNVGIGMDYPEYFAEIKDRTSVIDKMLSINIASVAKMTDIILPGMVSKHKGVILNISSGSALMPSPLLTIYSACKQFVDCFSKCLNSECQNTGVIVQSVMPFFVTTKMSKIRRSNLLIPTPSTYAKSTLKTIGKTNRTYGYFTHALQGAAIGLLPESMYMNIVISNMNKVRKRALKKLEAKKD